MVKLLLKWGADPSLPDNTGLTPLTMAWQLQREPLRKLMNTYVASSACTTPTGGETRRPGPIRKVSLRHNFFAIPWRK